MENDKSLIVQDWTNEMDLDSMFAKVSKLIEASVIPFKKAEDAVMAWQFGKDIGLKFSQSMNELYPIESNGVKRISAGVHIHEALLLANDDVEFHVIEDAEIVYHYAIRGIGTVTLTVAQLLQKVDEGYYQILTEDDFDENGKVLAEKTAKYQILRVDSPVPAGWEDRRTSIRFIRKSKNIDEIVTYHLHEAYAAGYLTKSTYQQNIRAMMYARCFTKGSKRYGSDISKGLLETGEAMVIAGKKPFYEDTSSVEEAPYEEID